MSYKQFADAIKKETFKKVYLFTGDERYLMERMAHQAKLLLVDPNFEDFNYQAFDGDQADFDTVLQAMETLPLMAEQKLIVVRNATYFKSLSPNDDQVKRFKRLLETESSFVALFFCSEGNDKRKKLYKEALVHGEELQFDRLDAKDFEKWVLRTMKDKGVEVPPGIMAYLIEVLSYLEYHSTKTLYHIEADLKQLSDFVGQGLLTREHIDQVLTKSVEGNVFVVIDAFSEGAFEKAMTLIDDLLLQGEPEIKILFMFARHFRLLYRTRIYTDQNYGIDAVAQELKMQKFQVQKLIRQCRTMTPEAIGKLLKIIEQADYSIKSGRMAAKTALDFVLGHFYMLNQVR